uniref:non-specific serine/threonine protein kinase n=1 Tax=Cyprinodon variegatus TaxID=28743 RepID=A0A3Q2CNU6_CYPVA
MNTLYLTHPLREPHVSVSSYVLLQVRLLSLATQHSDIVSVCYLLKEARIPVPQEPSLCNPAVLAAHCGFSNLLKELLDSIPSVCLKRDLVNCLLATACQQGHLEVVRLLVHSYEADVKDFAIHSNEFAVLCGLPLYAAAQASNEEIAHFLIENGAEFSSYTLMDYPDFSKRLLRQKLHETTGANGVEVCLVYWSGLQLPFLELDWIMDVCSQITHLDLSSNSLSALPSVVPWGLIHLKTLDLSSNALKELPFAQNSQDVICCRLQVVTLSHNQLKSLPTGLLHLTRLQKLSAANNQLTTLFDIPSNVNWIGLRKLEVLDVSGNSLTSLHTSVMHCLKSLRCLDVSRNRLRAFPDPWACPLRICKASSNIIENLPNTISIFWRTQLQEVDFSDNCLKELPSYIFELEAIMSLKLCGNLIETLPAPNKWKCSKLKTLDLSRNVLGRTEEGPRSRRLAFLTTWNRRDPDPVSPIEFPGVLRDSLEVLTLNDNQLECVPQSLCGLRNLTELYLSNNPGIRELPAELGQLSNLWQLDIDNLNITNIPQAVRKEGSASVLAFLRAQLRKAEPCRLLKMLVVGPPRQGKSALVEALLTGKASPFTPSECSISTFGLELEKPNSGKNNESIMFNLWDIGGPASMTTVNQCFFTDKSLYVVIWNLALGEEAVANLQTWLLNIEARAPNSAVVVVGTHLDLIDTKFRTERLATLRAYVLALCRSPSGARAAGYPDITFKHLHEVSCKTLEGLEGLKTLIYQVALSMKDSGSSACGAKLLGRLIPRSYFILQEAVIAEKERRDAAEEVQYLTDAQLLSIIEQNPESDIRDYEDLQTAISFLIETGTLLHFPDTSHGLCTLYFLCPVWLSDCLERIVHLNSCRPLPKNGLIQTEQLRKLLEGTGFTRETEEQYFQFLAKFEIALPVANNRYLLPHLLPPKPAMDIHSFHHHTNNTLQRLFKMSFVPAGFWERFIARMLISLTEMDLQRRSKNRRSSLIYSFAGSQQRNRCSTFRVRRSQTIYWKEGLLVTFDGGYLSVESSDVNWKKIKSGGIKIICQSDVRDFSAMAFITDHVNSLIEQWFPALTGSQNDGSLLIEQYVPCSLCAPCERQQQDPGEDDRGREAEVHYFNMEDCVLAAVEKDSIICPQHPEQPVPLQELVPELFMTDFPARLFLDKAELQLSEEEKDVLGQGGSGTIICRAMYKDQPVAVKHFHFKRCRQLTVSKDSVIHAGTSSVAVAPGKRAVCAARPMASRCVRQMEEPSFPCLRYLLSCDSQSQLFLSQLQGYSAVFWNGDNEERNYSVVNVEKAQVEVKRMCCPGNRISCQMKMRNSLWMATEEQEVFIYSLKDMCPLSQPQKRLSCPAVVTSLFHVPAGEQNLAKVFAGMSDGLVAVYTLVDDLPLDGETYLCSHTLNKTVFGLKDSDPRQRPYPVRSMALVSSGSQLWFSNGPGLLVIDTTSLQAVRRLEPYRTPSSVISMTTSFSLWGEEAVWTLDDTSNTLLLYYAASYELCASYCCGDRSPLRDVFDVLRPAGLAVVAEEDINTTDQNGKLEWSNGDVTLIFSEEAGTQIIQHQDSVTDYCSLSSTSSLEPPESNTLSTTDCSSLKSRGCLPLPQNPEDSEEHQDEQTDTDNLDSAEDINPATPELQAFNLLPVNGTLWIPRHGGDIIIIEMQPYGGQLRGRVTAVLAPPGRSSLGTLQEAALVAKDTVVCGFQQEENMEWCLVVWRAWSSSEISVFYQSYEELYRSESNIRIRR